MIRNNEYRDKLVALMQDCQQEYKRLTDANEPISRVMHTLRSSYAYKHLLQDYDRLHPETVQVESVIVRDKRGYKDEPAHMKGCVTLFHNLSCCNITLIDNALNIEIK